MVNIYVYKVAIGHSKAHLCKIGQSEKDKAKERLRQHARTPYYIFPPYLSFETNQPIATSFGVVDGFSADKIINDLFAYCQLTELEVYDIDYDEAIDKLLNDKRVFVYKDDNHTAMNTDQNNDNEPESTAREKAFKPLIQEILNSGDQNKIARLSEMTKELPVPEWLKNTKNYIILDDTNQYLSINYNKTGRMQILERLKEIRDLDPDLI